MNAVIAVGGATEPAVKRDTRRLTADLPTADSDLLAETARLTGFNKVTTLVRAIRVLADPRASSATAGRSS